jgi:hypothetical protein
VVGTALVSYTLDIPMDKGEANSNDYDGKDNGNNCNRPSNDN